MSDKPLVSVVMPVYNTAGYLRERLDGILGQSLQDLELICVDDGSTDESGAILDEYAAADSRVHVLHQQNQYAGVARNNGLAVARGTYVIFCDSDDFMEPEALKLMSEQAQRDDADICVCAGERYYEALDIKMTDPAYLHKNRLPAVMPFNRASNEEFIFSFTTVMIHNKMYRTAFLRDNDLRYSPRRNGEDVIFSALALWKAERITALDKPLVCYRIDRADSLVKTLSEDALGPLEGWLEVYRAIGSQLGAAKPSFDSKVVGVARHTLRNLPSIEVLRQCVDFVRDTLFPELGIEVQPEGYYPAAWYNSFIEALKELPFDEFIAFFLYMTAQDLDREEARKLSTRQKLEKQKAAVVKERDNAVKAKEKAIASRDKAVAAKQAAAKEKRAAVRERDRAQEKLLRIQTSRSYRLGRALTAPVRALRGGSK